MYFDLFGCYAHNSLKLVTCPWFRQLLLFFDKTFLESKITEINRQKDYKSICSTVANHLKLILYFNLEW